MALAPVTGDLKDITGLIMEAKEGVVRFTLNQPNLVSGTGGVRPDSTWEAPISSDGTFTINLERTDTMMLDAYYTVTVLWLQQTPSGLTKPAALTGYLDMKIRVPAGGGRLDKLVDPSAGGPGAGGPNNRIVYVSQTRPTQVRPWMLWIQMEPGENPDPFDPKNTGILYEYRPVG